MIKLRNLLESTLGSHYPGDAGEKETGYLRGEKIMKRRPYFGDRK